MKKADRLIIFNKYGGRCAYCGCDLEPGWHVDELLPVRRSWQYVKDEAGNRVWNRHKNDFEKVRTMEHPERLCLENQMPACASCNINKHSDSLEDFRKLIAGFTKHLNGVNTQYKIAKRYGLVHETIKPVVFYFETLPEAAQP